MNKELEITKEKLNTLEQAWENICVTGMDLNGHAGITVCESHIQFDLIYLSFMVSFFHQKEKTARKRQTRSWPTMKSYLFPSA